MFPRISFATIRYLLKTGGNVAVLLGAYSNILAAADYYVIPYDVDPPIVVDGDLSDGSNVPNGIAFEHENQVGWGKDNCELRHVKFERHNENGMAVNGSADLGGDCR